MMLRLLLLPTLVCLAQSYRSDHISRNGKSFFVKESDPDTCTALFSCWNCQTARVCRPSDSGWVEVARIACPPFTPYCRAATGSCSTEPDPDCGSPDIFGCPAEEGHYPDPANTTVYHVCENYAASQFACASGLVYNPLTKDCEVSTPERAPLSCDSDGLKVPFPGYPNYFAYCFDKNPVMVDRCIGNYELNVTSQACEATCHGDGVLRDFEDCTKFYLCRTTRFSKSLVFTFRLHRQCPPGQGFDPKIYMCGPLEDIDGCSGSPTTISPTGVTTSYTSRSTPLTTGSPSINTTVQPTVTSPSTDASTTAPPTQTWPSTNTTVQPTITSHSTNTSTTAPPTQTWPTPTTTCLPPSTMTSPDTMTTTISPPSTSATPPSSTTTTLTTPCTP